MVKAINLVFFSRFNLFLLMSTLLTACGSGSSSSTSINPPPDNTTSPPVVSIPDYNLSYLERPVQDDIFYFVMLDRFINGDHSNDHGASEASVAQGGFDNTHKGFFHGGDLVGLESKLDYIQQLGATAVWLTPILTNRAVQDTAAYHGYWIVDFTQVDPHFGTGAQLKSLIDTAHSKGLKVFFDIITNHTADVIRYEECHDAEGILLPELTDCVYRPLSTVATEGSYTPFIPEELANVKVPQWLNDPKFYHNQGNSTFSGENSLYGDFFGLDDIDTNQPEVLAGMLEIFKNLVTEFKPDGFRVDTVKHVNLDFWQTFVPELSAHAQAEGIPNFYIFAEVFDSTPEFLSLFTTQGQFPATLDFGLHSAVNSVFASNDSPQVFAKLFSKDDLYNDTDSNALNLMNFISNHDIGRIGHFIGNNLPDSSLEERAQRSLLSHAFMFFARGIPVIYYGDEQGFTGDGGDQDAREDMMPSLVESYNDNILLGTQSTTANDNFNQDHPFYLAFNTLAHLYHNHSALRHGVHINRFASEEAGIYAFSRIDPNEKLDYIVAFNSATTGQTATFTTQTSEYELITGDGTFTLENEQITLSLPALSFSIFKAQSPLTATNNDIHIAGVTNGDLVSGLMTLNYPLETDTVIAVDKVTTSIRIDDGEFIPVVVDQTPPYSAALDTTLWPNGANIEVKVDYEQADSTTQHRVQVIVENRSPQALSIRYENLNAAHFVYAVDNSGNLQGPYAISESLEQLQWDEKMASLTLFFTRWTDGEQPAFIVDQPITLTRQQLVRLAIENEQQQLEVHLFINGAGEISTENNHSGNKPLLFPVTENDAPPMLDSGELGNPNDDLYVRGSINGWGIDDPMQYLGYSTYHRSIHVTQGDAEFKFADANWSPINLGGPISSQGLTLGSDPANLQHHFTQTALYDFYVQLYQHDSQMHYLPLFTENLGPVQDQVFIRGTMNEWQAQGEQRLVHQGEGLYQGEFVLLAGDYQFKLANSDWSYDRSTAESNNGIIELNVPKPLASGTGADNLSFHAAVDGIYRINYLLNNTTEALTIELQSQIGADTPPLGFDVYLKGERDGWNDGLLMEYIGSGRYQLAVYADLESFTGLPNQNDDTLWDFKFADLNWSQLNLGGPTTPSFSFNTELTLTNDSASDNLGLVLPGAGLYTFTLHAANPNAYKVTVIYEAVTQLSLHYWRPQADYEQWGIHVWGEGVHPSLIEQVTWINPWPFHGTDDFGVFSHILLNDLNDTVGIILHAGDEKDPGPDMLIDPTLGTDIWINSGNTTIFYHQDAALAAR